MLPGEGIGEQNLSLLLLSAFFQFYLLYQFHFFWTFNPNVGLTGSVLRSFTVILLYLFVLFRPIMIDLSLAVGLLLYCYIIYYIVAV